MELATALELYKSKKFREAEVALKEIAEKHLSEGHKGAASHAEAWMYLARSSAAMDVPMLQEAHNELVVASELFRMLQPSDSIGEKICAARSAEVCALQFLREKKFWDARKLFLEAKSIYLDRGDKISVQRTIFGMALANGTDLEAKGDLCFQQGEFSVALDAFDAACTAFLQANIHDGNKPCFEGLASILRQRITRNVALCVNKREKSRELASVLNNATLTVSQAETLAESRDYAGAFEAMQNAANLFSMLGASFEAKTKSAREQGEQYYIQRLNSAEAEVEKSMRGNEYAHATTLALRTCKQYAELASQTKKRNATVSQEARVGHIRMTAALLEIAGTQAWWQWFNQTDGLPALPHAYPGWLLAEGTAGTTSEGLGSGDPGRVLADMTQGVLFDHHKRVARRGYDQGMLFGEASRLLAVAGRPSAGMRLQLFRTIEKGYYEWAQQGWQNAATCFSSAAENLSNAYHGIDAFDRGQALQCAMVSFQTLAATARALQHIDNKEKSDELAAELREWIQRCEEIRPFLSSQSGLDVFVSNARRAVLQLLPDERADDLVSPVPEVDSDFVDSGRSIK